MNQEIAILSLAKTKNDSTQNPLLEKISKNLYKKYLLKKLPIKIEDISYLGETGKEYILPFTKDTLADYDTDFLRKYMEGVQTKYDIIHAYCTNKLNKFIHKENSSYYSLLKYLVLDQIIINVLHDYQLSWRDTKLVIIDSEDNKIDFLLELLVWNLNYLTIITKRQEYFKDIKEMIYLNTGLIVEIVENPVKECINGTIIIDANKELCKNYNYFEKNAIILDLETNQTKIQYLNARRKDLNVVYDVKVTAKKEELDHNLLCYILYQKSDLCTKFINNNLNKSDMKELLEISKKYDIRLQELKYIH